MRITSFVSLAVTKVSTRQVPTTTIRVLSIQAAGLFDAHHFFCKFGSHQSWYTPYTNYNYKGSFYTSCWPARRVPLQCAADVAGTTTKYQQL